MTQVARGLDPSGLLLLDVVVRGVIPESLADADLQAQVRASPGRFSCSCPAGFALAGDNRNCRGEWPWRTGSPWTWPSVCRGGQGCQPGCSDALFPLVLPLPPRLWARLPGGR